MMTIMMMINDDKIQYPIDKQTADNSANTVADKWSFGEETEQICSYNDQSAARPTIQEACQRRRASANKTNHQSTDQLVSKR